MANLNETCTGLVVVMGATVSLSKDDRGMQDMAHAQSLAFTAWHTYKFDGGKCLVPKKKEWFRVLLTVSRALQRTTLQTGRIAS